MIYLDADTMADLAAIIWLDTVLPDGTLQSSGGQMAKTKGIG